MFELITPQQAEEHLEALTHSPLAWGTGEDAIKTIIWLWEKNQQQQAEIERLKGGK